MRYQVKDRAWYADPVVEDTQTEKVVCSCSFDDNAAVKIAAALNAADEGPSKEEIDEAIK